MSPEQALALVVDDSQVNRKVLARHLASLDIVYGRERWWVGDHKDAFYWPPMALGNTLYAAASRGLMAFER